MSVIRFAKVASLPATLQPNTMYLVRVGAGFDLYVSDATGSMAYPVNPVEHAGAIAWPRRLNTPKIAGDVTAQGLTGQVLIASRQYFVPFTVPCTVSLTGLRLSVFTPAVGTASIGIYGNTRVAGNDTPGNLLVSVTGLDTGTTGDKTGTVSYTLNPSVLYWASLICSAAVTLRALSAASNQTSLGRNANAGITHLFAAGSGSTLPTTAPTSLTDSGSATPAIYLVGS